MVEKAIMKCSNCDGTGNVPDPEPPSKGASTFGTIMGVVVFGFIVWCVGGFMHDCAGTRIGGGMCGLIGIEAAMPLSLLWLFRKLR